MNNDFHVHTEAERGTVYNIIKGTPQQGARCITKFPTEESMVSHIYAESAFFHILNFHGLLKYCPYMADPIIS